MTSFTRSLLSRSAAAQPPRRGRARSVRSRPWRDLTARPRLEVLEDRTLLSGSGSASQAIQAAYGQLPLAFEANQGQAAAPINFVAHGSGYNLALTPGEAVLSLQKPARTPGTQASGTPGDVVQLQLVGANPTAPVSGLDELITKSNYFIGNDPSQWHTDIANYGQVEYQDVYPGVNLVYYGNQQQLEYDFVVAPGADPGVITLAVQGTQGHDSGRPGEPGAAHGGGRRRGAGPGAVPGDRRRPSGGLGSVRARGERTRSASRWEPTTAASRWSSTRC